MEMQVLKIHDIKPYENNPRRNEAAVEAVAESIKQTGYNAPIVVDEDHIVLAGHTRLKALELLRYDEVEVVVKTDLTEEQKRKYRLLDNKVGELAGWDFEKLEAELEGLDFGEFDFGFGFEEMRDESAENQNKEPVDLSDQVSAIYKILIECESEEQQEEAYNRLTEEGYVCRVLTL